MSKKLNNLRKRARIDAERFAKRERDLSRRELIVADTERQIKKASALNIVVERAEWRSTELMELRVQFHPDKFLFGARMIGGVSDIGWHFRQVAEDASRKIFNALMEKATAQP